MEPGRRRRNQTTDARAPLRDRRLLRERAARDQVPGVPEQRFVDIQVVEDRVVDDEGEAVALLAAEDEGDAEVVQLVQRGGRAAHGIVESLAVRVVRREEVAAAAAALDEWDAG
jgi:hypothetical protein